MTEFQRIKMIREHKGLSQTAFGKELGLKQGSYSGVESGENGVSGPVKELLRYKFRVNIQWLETGEGEMFLSESDKSLPVPGKGVIETMQDEITELRGLVIEAEERNQVMDDELTLLYEALKMKRPVLPKKIG